MGFTMCFAPYNCAVSTMTVIIVLSSACAMDADRSARAD